MNKKRALSKSERLFAAFFFLFGICLNAAAQDVAVFPQLGHANDVRSVAFSPDGKQVLSGSLDHTIKLWDVESGREIRTFLGHTEWVNSVAFSPDGKQTLSCSGDQTIKLWDVNTGKEIRTFLGHTWEVTSVAFSPDGKQVLSGARDRTVKLWDVNTGKEIRKYSNFTGDRFNSIAFNPDGRQIVFPTYNNKFLLFDINAEKEIKIFSGHTSEVSSVAFSHDGRQIISGSLDHTLKLWDTNSGSEIRTFSGHTGWVSSVSFSPDGKRILSGALDNTIKLWDVNTGKEIKTFTGHTDMVWSVKFSPDGKQVLSGSLDNTIKLWDVNTGMEIKSFSRYINIVASASFSPDRKQILSSFGSYTQNNTIKLWDADTGKEIRTFSGHTHWILSLAFSPDGRQVLSGSYDGTITLWDVNTGREIRTFSCPTDLTSNVAFSPDGKQFISNYRGSIRLWDINTGREIWTHSSDLDWFSTVKFSPDGKQVISDYGSQIKLWDTKTGKEIRTFSGHTHWILSLAFSPDGRQLLSGSRDGTLKLWDINTGNEIKTFFEPTENNYGDGVRSISFSPDGKQVLFSYFGKMKLWDVNTWSEIKTFPEYINNYGEFSPDGKQILSRSGDGTIRLWDISTGQEIAQYISFTDGEWICLTPDGYYNASPKGDKYLNVRVGNNVYGIDQYRNTFYRPQIVEARLQGRPDPVRVATTIQDAASFVPPDVVIMRPEKGATLSSNQVELAVTVIDQRQPIKTIKVQVNGRPVAGETLRGSISGINRGELELETTQIRLTGNQNRVEFRLPVTLDPGANRIEVIATNPYSESNKEAVDVNYRQSATEQNILPNLWILSIGINRYDSPLLQNLDYAVNDAREIINVFKSQEGRLYRKVNYKLIADGEKDTPIRDNIVDNFAFLKQASQRDVVLLFIAGHGQNDENGYFYFMPSDAAFHDDGSIRPSRAISYRDIQSVLDVPGQKLVFIDTCHSEGVSGKSTKTRGGDTNQLVRALQDNSTVIFTASRGGEQSQELKELKHGVFTYAIIQGMRGEADLNIGGLKDGQVTMKELDAYVSEMVPKLTNKSQHPTTITPDGYTNFVVADLK